MSILKVWNFVRFYFKEISIGKGSKIDFTALLSTTYGGYISIGNHTEVRKGAILLSGGGSIVIGDNCSINPYCVIYGNGGLSIGNGVRIAAHTTIVPTSHRFDRCDKYIYEQGLTSSGITIEDDVWIGAGVAILDGVTIAKGCIIGANAVLNKCTEPYGIYAGVPAKLIKKRCEHFIATQ